MKLAWRERRYSTALERNRRPDRRAIADEQGARWLAEQIAIAVQYSLLLRHAPDFVSDSFGRARSTGRI